PPLRPRLGAGPSSQCTVRATSYSGARLERRRACPLPARSSSDGLEDMSVFTLDRDTVLRKAVELGGSDLILTAHYPVMITVAGTLQPMLGSPLLTAADARRLGESFLTPALHEKFLRDQELDTRFHLPGVANFRVNLYIQRGNWGVAIRIVPLSIPLPSEIGLAPHIVSR